MTDDDEAPVQQIMYGHKEIILGKNVDTLEQDTASIQQVRSVGRATDHAAGNTAVSAALQQHRGCQLN